MTSPEPSSAAVASPEHTAARVRATLAYANLRYEDVAERTDGTLTASTLRRIASASNPRGAELNELWSIADACQVPRDWLERGEWSDTAGRADVSPPRFGKGSLSDRVTLLERYVQALISLHRDRTGEYPLPEFDAAGPQPLAH